MEELSLGLEIRSSTDLYDNVQRKNYTVCEIGPEVACTNCIRICTED